MQRLGIGILAVSVVGGSLGFTQLSAQAAKITLNDGATCEGNFSGGSGTGICVFDKKVDVGRPYNYYRGQVRNSLPNGTGIFVYENDDRYEGSVRNGLPNGKGTYLFSSGARYDGGFSNGQFNGQGTLVYGDGSRYVGTFRNGSFYGKGTLTMANGLMSYQGGIREGQPHGKGVLKFAGNTYSGDFYLGQVNGQGVLTDSDGVVCRGTFFNSYLSGKATCTYPAGNPFKSYTGELRGGKPDGKGVVVYANGKRFAGQFRGGEPVNP